MCTETRWFQAAIKYRPTASPVYREMICPFGEPHRLTADVQLDIRRHAQTTADKLAAQHNCEIEYTVGAVLLWPITEHTWIPQTDLT